MSWAEEQDWFGTEDMLENITERQDPRELIKQGYWVQNDWEPIALTAMTDHHLYNCIRMIEDGRLNRRWALPYLVAEQARRINKVSKS